MPEITPYNIEDYTEPVVNEFSEFDLLIFAYVASLLADYKEYDEPLTFLTAKLALVSDLEHYARDKLNSVTDYTSVAISALIEQSGLDTIESVDKEVKQLGIDGLPNANVLPINQAITSTYNDLNINVNQRLITNNFGRGTITQTYEQILNESVSRVFGGKTIAQAVDEVLFQIADKGLPSGFVDRGGNVWSAERYVNGVMRTTVNNLYNDMRVSRMDEYGVHTVLVSTISDSAPRCQHVQGKVVDTRPVGQNDSGYPSVYEFGYGGPGQHRGVSCRHSWFTYIPNVSTNNQPQFNVEEVEKAYEIKQRQRLLERRIRKTKKNIAIAENIGSDRLDHYKKLLRSQQATIRQHVADNGLRRQYDREKVR